MSQESPERGYYFVSLFLIWSEKKKTTESEIREIITFEININTQLLIYF